MVAPTRVVFEGRKRAAEVNLTNNALSRATYRISLVRMDMDESGGFREVPLDPGSENLLALFRFSPREVTLEAQESQTVRIQVRKPAELPDGEYRLHMVFRAVPKAPDQPSTSTEPRKGLSISLTPIYGVAIPLIIRHGSTSVTATITEPALDLADRTLRFRLGRTGNQSVYGDLQASLVIPNQNPQVLAESNGLAVYTPNASRKVTLHLPSNLILPHGGRIRITYKLPDGGALLAESFLNLP